MRKEFIVPLMVIALSTSIRAQERPSIAFQVNLNKPGQSYHIRMEGVGIEKDSVLLKMPAWTPGYYQLLHFADHVSAYKAFTTSGKEIPFIRAGRNGWKFKALEKKFIVEYDVKAARAFVAVPFLDYDHGYIAPTGIFMHPAGMTDIPVTVQINLQENWIVATGLERSKQNEFLAQDFDVLYDSPILLGDLEELPPFEVKGIPHRFIGYKLGNFDRTGFMNGLKKIVEVATTLIGDIPYKQYTFLAIGPGPGGIEHLNSTTFGFSGDALKSEEGQKRIYTFLAHEYFHHYNVKRIRPIELGPFDYDKENHTNMLWVSEGFTVYYDVMIAKRAGLLTDNDVYSMFKGRLLGFENKPGRLYQSATQASYNTWSDGPFGRSDDEVNKTVSVYDKGSVLGLMLDFNIRHVTQNKRSLDDVMRALYKEFYQQKKRGFTEVEFQNTCETVAGNKLTELFEYASTVTAPDYKKYFAYGGLDVETQPKQVAGAWLGVSTRMRNDSLTISNVEYESPAWSAGLRRGMVVLKMNGQKPTSLIEPMLTDRSIGDKISLDVYRKGQAKNISLQLGTKVEPSFVITPLPNPTNLQLEIRKSWLGLK